MMRIGWAGSTVLMAMVVGCGSAAPRYMVGELATTRATTEADEQANDTPPDWSVVTRAVGHDGVKHDGVFTVTVPRTDLVVDHEMMDVPIAAGVASVFHFFKCSCGKFNIVGSFVLPEYETNDVIDAVRKGSRIKIVAISPFMLETRPHLVELRIQGEGALADLAADLREALSWTGDARMTTQPAK